MMKLSLMKDVFETVNSDWDCELAKELLKKWNHNDNWIKMWRASANFISFFKNNKVDYVIRFNKDSERAKLDLKSEINLLQYLDSKAINVAKPVTSKTNKYIEESKTAYGTFFSVVFERIIGKQKEIDELDLQGFFEWGRSLGELHKVLKNIPESISIQRKTHNELFEELINAYPPKDKVEEAEKKRIVEWFKSLAMKSENYGLIHYDFELDNLIWDNSGITIIDFDDCIYSWYIADIAYALRDLFDEGETDRKNDKRFIKFIDGYKSKTELHKEELLQLPYFFRLHNFISYKKLQRSIDIDISDDNPKWMNELIEKLKLEYMERYYRNFKKNIAW
jgi:Ser/Thr protein kinase RdoA (MazF antagonist)